MYYLQGAGESCSSSCTPVLQKSSCKAEHTVGISPDQTELIFLNRAFSTGMWMCMQWSTILENILELFLVNIHIMWHIFMGTYRHTQSQIWCQRVIHSPAVPSSPCENYNHIGCGKFERLQRKAYLSAQRISLINFSNASSLRQVWYNFHCHLYPGLLNTGVTIGPPELNHNQIL